MCPSKPPREELGWLLGAAGEYSRERAALADVRPFFTAALAIAERLAKADPGNAGWQRDLSVSYNRIGDVLVAQGNLPEALKSYRDGQTIFERLAKADWQYDLGISNERMGDVQMAQGDLAAALISYEARRDIISRLAKSDPGNAGWQRDLSVSYAKLADAYRKSNETAKARDALAAGLFEIVTQTK
jgi:tetratricopeptide (TPR) repeat protein